MTNAQKRAARRLQQTTEIEANQADLRASIAESERLVGEAERILRRHRKECDEDDKDDAASQTPPSA